MKTIINSDLPSARSQKTTMKTIMKMDPPSAKSIALRRPQRGADTCDYGLQQVISHGNIVGHVTTSWVDAIHNNVALWDIQVITKMVVEL